MEDALPSTSTANQNDPKDTPHRSITTSGPLLRDILPGEVPFESPDSRENHVLSLPIPKGGADPLKSSDPTLMLHELTASDLDFIWILSMWINTKEELDKLALSLRLDLNQVDNALHIWPDYNHACQYLLIEWFLKASLRLTLPCLRVAFHSLGKAKEIDTFISRGWFLRDLKENIVPLCQPPHRTRFLLELTKLINSGNNISNLQLVISCLELNAERVTALRVFFPQLFTAIAYFNLEDWCRQYDDHHSLTDWMEALHSIFIHMGKEKDFLNILTSHYPWFIPVEPECKWLHIQSPLTRSHSHSPSKSTPVTKPQHQIQSVTPNRVRPQPKQPDRPWKPSAATYTQENTWTDADSKWTPKIDVTGINWCILRFLRDLADAICCESEIRGIANSLLYDMPTLDYNLRQWNDKFEWIVLLTLVDWYNHATGTVQLKVDKLRRAFYNISLPRPFDSCLEDHLFRMPGYLPHYFNIPAQSQKSVD